MKKMKKIGVFTGARAEYWLLKPLMEEINRDEELELVLIVSSMHLSPEFGLTYRQIEKDGFEIKEKIETLLSSDSATGVGKAVGLGLIGYAQALERLAPDVMVLLGDRYETLAMTIACVLHNVPVSHIHGGELSFGAWDDAFRHAITKMSLLHFTCADEYEKRVIQMGEHPDHVFNVGSLGVEAAVRTPLLTRHEFFQMAGFDPEDRFLIVTFHPVTREDEYGGSGFAELVRALACERFKKFRIIFTKANSDAGGRLINDLIDQYVQACPEQATAFDAMGQINYLSAMKYACAMAGNSSSGILEAPCFCLPVVNIGSRQDGRIRPANIIDCSCDSKSIVKCLEKALDPEFRKSLENMENPFHKPGTAAAIKNIIKEYDFDGRITKIFFDLPERFVKGGN